MIKNQDSWHKGECVLSLSVPLPSPSPSYNSFSKCQNIVKDFYFIAMLEKNNYGLHLLIKKPVSLNLSWRRLYYF